MHFVIITDGVMVLCKNYVHRFFVNGKGYMELDNGIDIQGLAFSLYNFTAFYFTYHVSCIKSYVQDYVAQL